jgi:cell shape-determining protein MreD
MKYVLGFVGIIGLFIESSLVAIPFSLIFILLIFINRKDGMVFTIAFLLGIVLDILLIRQVGLTGLFFVVFLFLVSLYDRKYEINTWPFVLLSSFFGAAFYAQLFGTSDVLVTSFVTMIMSVVAFLCMKFLTVRFAAKKMRY